MAFQLSWQHFGAGPAADEPAGELVSQPTNGQAAGRALQRWQAGRTYRYGSLRNVDEDGDGRPEGCAFRFRVPVGRAYFYVARRLVLTVDGEAVDPRRIWLLARGERHRATELVATDLVALEGEELGIFVEQFGGLAPGRHTLELEVPQAGNFAGAGQAVWLVAAQDDLAASGDAGHPAGGEPPR